MGKNTNTSRYFVPAQSLFDLSQGYYRDKGVSTYARSSLNVDATGNPMFFKRFFVPQTIRVTGIIAPLTTAVATNAWVFNLGIFSEYTSGADSLPYGLVDATNGQGVLTMAVSASNEVNHKLNLPGSVLLEGGYEYFLGYLTQVGGLTGGALAIRNTCRYLGNLNLAGGYTRYDVKSSVNIAYVGTTLATPFATIGASWTDGLSGLQNVDWAFTTERV